MTHLAVPLIHWWILFSNRRYIRNGLILDTYMDPSYVSLAASDPHLFQAQNKTNALH